MSAVSGFLTRNWTLKLSAFGIALLLWVSVRVEAPTRQTVSGVPVRVDLADPEWALAEEPSPTTVVVRFGGPSRDLFAMGMDRPSIVIPLTEVNSADTTVVLRNQWVRVPDRPNVVVEDIQPSSVRLRLDAIQRVNLPVAVRLEGQLPEGLAVAGPPRTTPADVRLSGPEGRVSEWDSLRLEPVDLTAVEGPGTLQVAVDTTGLQGLQIQPSQVDVELQVVDRVERLLDEVAVVLGLDDWEEHYEIQPAGAPVLLSGARSLLDGVSPGALRLLADVDEEDLPVEPGEEVQVPVSALVLEGLPPYLQGEIEVEEITIVRLDDPADDEAAGGSEIP